MFHYYCCLCEWLTVDYIKLDGKGRVGKIGSRVPSKVSSGGQGSHLIGLSGVFWTKVPSAVCPFTNWIHSRRIPWKCIIKCNALLDIKLASSIANCPFFFNMEETLMIGMPIHVLTLQTYDVHIKTFFSKLN